MKSGIYEAVQKTASELPHEMYFMISEKLGNYDFTKKGFTLSLGFPTTDWHAFSSTSPVKANYKNNYFIEMSQEEAESLKKRLNNPALQSNHPQNGLVYILYRFEFLKDKLSLNEKNYHDTRLVGVIKSGSFEVFEDPYLKRKIKDVKLNNTSAGAATTKAPATQAVPAGSIAAMPVKLGNSGLADFNIISYKGLPVIGETAGIEKTIIPPGDNSFSYPCYMSLLNFSRGQDLMKYRKSPFQKQEPNTAWTREMEYSQMANMVLINTLGMLTDEESYNQFFCNDKSCSGLREGGRYRTVMGKSTYSNELKWGGSSENEFDSREAYARYEKSGLDKSIAAAAAKIPKTAYVISRVYAGEYDFDKEAFPVTVSNILPFGGAGAGFTNKDKTESYKLYYKLSPDKAKEFKNSMPKGPHATIPLMVVYKIKFLDEMPQSYDQLTGGTYELAGAEFELFENNFLQNKITTLTLNK